MSPHANRINPVCRKGSRQRTSRPEAASDAQRYIGDTGKPLDGPLDYATVGAPMILLALAIGFVVGAAVWAILGLSNLIVGLIWTNLRSVASVPWFPLAVCTIGGAVIGLWTKATRNTPAPLEKVMAEVKRTGGYRLDGVAKSIVSFLLPLAFGGSIGPEAGLTGIIAGACTWIGKTFKRAGLRAKAVADLTISASLSAIFGAPFAGIVATIEDGEEQSYTFRCPAKIILYTATAFGALGGMMLLSSAIGGSSGLPRFESIEATGAELLWVVPLALCGYLLSLVFHASSKACAAAAEAIGDRIVVKTVICGAVMGAIAMFLPDVLFAGEEQSKEIMAEWTGVGTAALLATGVVKLFATPLCLNFGWHGGNFFPSIFAGISFGYGIAAATGVDPMLCVTATATALVSGVTRKPLLAVALLLLCFPADGILWSGLSAVIAAAIPLPKVLAAPSARPTSDDPEKMATHKASL